MMNWNEFDTMVNNGLSTIAMEFMLDSQVSKEDIKDRQQLELSWTQSRYDQETRDYAANTLVDALLASCDTHEERIELSVNLLGYDPRC